MTPKLNELKPQLTADNVDTLDRLRALGYSPNWRVLLDGRVRLVRSITEISSGDPLVGFADPSHPDFGRARLEPIVYRRMSALPQL